MTIVERINAKLFELYQSYNNVQNYIVKWQEDYDDFGHSNFDLFFVENHIDVRKTLHNIDGETLLKIAIDLGIETPDFIPSIPMFKNELKSSYETASQTFEKAFREVEEDPSLAIGLANSALESIIKEILTRLNVVYTPQDTLSKLAKNIFKNIETNYNTNCPSEIKTICSSLVNICNRIEDLRSSKTEFHGKTNDDFIITDPLIAYFVVNSAATVGLFLINYFKKIEKQAKTIVPSDDDELPF